MKDFNENIKKMVAAINASPPEQYTFVCEGEDTPEPDLYKMAHHAYEKVLGVGITLQEVQMKIPHDRPALCGKCQETQQAAIQALNAVYAVIAEISRREKLEETAQKIVQEVAEEDPYTYNDNNGKMECAFCYDTYGFGAREKHTKDHDPDCLITRARNLVQQIQPKEQQ